MQSLFGFKNWSGIEGPYSGLDGWSGGQVTLGANIIALVQSIGPVVGCKVSLVLKTGLAPRVVTLVRWLVRWPGYLGREHHCSGSECWSGCWLQSLSVFKNRSGSEGPYSGSYDWSGVHITLGANIIALVQSIGPAVGCKVSLVLKTGPTPRVLTLV